MVPLVHRQSGLPLVVAKTSGDSSQERTPTCFVVHLVLHGAVAHIVDIEAECSDLEGRVTGIFGSEDISGPRWEIAVL